MIATENVAPELAIDGARVGHVIVSRNVEVQFRDSALYAAAIDAERDLYLDDRTAGGALAPPTFLASLEWPLVSGPPFLNAIDMRSDDLYRRLLHSFQDSWFFRPIRTGDRLSIEARLASITPTATGALVITQLLTADSRSGARVGESWFGSYFRGVSVTNACTALERPAIVSLATQQSMCTPINISRSRSHIYSECARLQNPIHTDLSFATSLELPDIALHGTLIWATLGELTIDRYAGGDPTRLRRLAMRFRRPIFPNREMIAETAIADAVVNQIAINLRDAEDNELLVGGLALLKWT